MCPSMPIKLRPKPNTHTPRAGKGQRGSSFDVSGGNLNDRF